MTELTVTTVELPTAPLGPSSPLPMLHTIQPVGAIAADVPTDIAARARTGAPPSLHPYLAQDDYQRRLTPRRWRVAVLENEALRATVALDLGGRLLSLVDRRAGRELLYVNPVQQPANLALRNAWFSGGVEWNIGTRGHSPTTMDTLHAARVDGPGGEPVLRLWEWERIRGVVFQVDLRLPTASAALLATVRIRNPSERAVPMYWWTNAAVVAGPTTRVLVPSRRAVRTEYPNGLRMAAVPVDGDLDVTYPANHHLAADCFFEIDSDATARPWIAAIDGDGRGVAHVSTARLQGRKLFVWGTGRGGERWQGWLSHGGAERYAEIQGGLAPTQFEHLDMPAQAEWSWSEAFAAVDVDPTLGHGDDWDRAVGAATAAVDEVAAESQLAHWHAEALDAADRPPADSLAVGSGWGALERRRRTAAGEAWFDETGTPFGDDTVGEDQAHWLTLLESGSLPVQRPADAPRSYVVGGDWDARLAGAPPSWTTEYHRGVLAHGRADLPAAEEHYRASMARAPSAWAARGLAEAARATGNAPDAAAHALEAHRLAPDEWRLAAEALARLLDDERPGDALAVVAALAPSTRARGRIRLLEAWAALGTGDLDRVDAILAAGLEIADLREGERSIDQLWRAAFPDRDVPAPYDFRMVAD